MEPNILNCATQYRKGLKLSKETCYWAVLISPLRLREKVYLPVSTQTYLIMKTFKMQIHQRQGSSAENIVVQRNVFPIEVCVLPMYWKLFLLLVISSSFSSLMLNTFF